MPLETQLSLCHTIKYKDVLFCFDKFYLFLVVNNLDRMDKLGYDQHIKTDVFKYIAWVLQPRNMFFSKSFLGTGKHFQVASSC